MKVVVARLSLVCVSLIVMSLMLTGQSSAVERADAVGIWLFDEGTGDVAKDSSGNGNDGKLIKRPKWVKGKFGTALEFDAQANYIDCGNDASLKPASAITIALWFKTPDSGTHRQLVSDLTLAGFHGYDLMIRDTGIVYMQFGTGSGWCPSESIAAYDDDKWYLFVGTWSGGDLDMYIDGAEVSYAQHCNTAKYSPAIGEPTYIGIYGPQIGGPGNFFNGIIDEVTIFNVALTENDIQSIMTKGLKSVAAVSPTGKLATAWGAIKVQ